MKPAAFRATYSDYKLVKTRKVAQFIFEVPLEAVNEALNVVGGMPNPASEQWFGIAPLKAETATATRTKQNWRDMLPSAQAAIRCNEPIFWAYLIEQHNELIAGKPTNPEECAETIRSLCDVKSRSELNTNHGPRVIWHQLDEGFQAWKVLEQAS